VTKDVIAFYESIWVGQMKQGGTAIFVLSSLAYRVFLFARDFLVYSEVRKTSGTEGDICF